MTPREPYKNRIALLQGALDMLILQTLQWGPQHGHGIGQRNALKDFGNVALIKEVTRAAWRR